jgi:hypothetical protein
VMVDTSEVIGDVTAATQGWQFALYMPQTGNNDNCLVGNFSTEGQNYGFVASEHTRAVTVRCIYCICALVVAGGSGSSMPHCTYIDYVSAESCQVSLEINYDTAYPTKIEVGLLDIESGSGDFAFFHVINDPNDYGEGTVTLGDITTAAPVTSTFLSGSGQLLNGAANLKFVNAETPRGVLTGGAAPSVPSSGVALVNGSGRDAAVIVTGGTVSGIEVNGNSVGVTSGTIYVPASMTITVTYTSAPTWTWTLL